jgi:uncharacterized repeat protein (TIGR01451 family)
MRVKYIQKQKILILLANVAVFAVAAGFLLVSALPVRAGTISVVTFETKPLFSEADFMPGDSVSKWVEVENIHTADITARANAANISDPGHLGDDISLTVKRGVQIFYTGPLSGFFAAGSLDLGAIAAGETARYDFIAGFNFGAGDAYQGKALAFDINVTAEGPGGNGGNDPACGDGTCAAGEDCANCPSDCGSCGGVTFFCGNGLCAGSETCANCPSDCGLCPDGGSGTGGGEVDFFLSPARPDSVKVLGESGAPVLTIKKTLLIGRPVNPGEKNVPYRLEIANTGNLSAYNAAVKDVLPDGLAFSGSNSREKEWPLSELSPAEAISIEYLADVSAAALAGVYTNTAAVRADNHPAVTATADLAVREITALGWAGEELGRTGFAAGELWFLIGLAGLFGAAAGYLRSAGRCGKSALPNRARCDKN